MEVSESDVLGKVADAPHPVPTPHPMPPLHLAARESRPFIRNQASRSLASGTFLRVPTGWSEVDNLRLSSEEGRGGVRLSPAGSDAISR